MAINRNGLSPAAWLAAVICWLAVVPLSSQAANPGSWSPARTPDGQPDIQGYWATAADSATQENIEDGLDPLHNQILGRRLKPIQMVVDPPDRRIPYQPWAAARKKEVFDNRDNPKAEDLDPAARCYLPGVPRITYMPFGFKILQTPGYVVILSESFHTYRIIPVDGRPHVGKDISLWMGDGRGRWEGATLVVEVTNNDRRPWFDMAGNFHSDAFNVVERWTMVDADTIGYQATMADAKVYTRPWTIAFSFTRNKQPQYELMEEACHEGNRALELMVRPEVK